ncbi:Uncharacterised protein [Bordetella pertussis]|nr:Uncharacterised protein [Bordetella pertussis]CFP62779.1 Uncharacterised protein [Bordetella pertussis]
MLAGWLLGIPALTVKMAACTINSRSSDNKVSK